MAENRFLVVLPTYNERQNLPHMVAALEPELRNAPFPGEVLVVDDASPDGTGREADRLTAEYPWLHVLHREGKEGLGRAYTAGFRWALERPFTHVLEMDCDLSHPPSALPAMLAASEHADLVLGSRYTDGGGVEGWPLSRRLISRGGCLYARAMLGVSVRDLTGGYKCFRRWVLERLELDAVRAAGYTFQIELTYRTLRAGGRVVEVPITFADRARGESKMSRSIVLEAIWQVPALRLRAATGLLERPRKRDQGASLVG